MAGGGLLSPRVLVGGDFFVALGSAFLRSRATGEFRIYSRAGSSGSFVKDVSRFSTGILNVLKDVETPY